jgi:hypothetical protein
MSRIDIKVVFVMVGMLLASSVEAAVDSYRFLHVTIATPWYLFIFLLGGVFAPFILMAVLAWHSAIRKVNREAATTDTKSAVE